jgi:NADH:ubiquinone oxidoreductase subunit 5 (subunit L)/multisubunit Na+/H+ antiporter MnhA subunit
MTALLWLLVGLPLMSGAALAVAGRLADPIAYLAACVVATVVVGLSAVAAVARPAVTAPFLPAAPVRLGLDGLSAAMVVTVAVVTLGVLVAGGAEVAPRQPRARFCGLLLLFAGAVLTTVTARTLPPLLLSWEVMGATSYALIGFWWSDIDRVRSGAVAFLTTRAADLGLYAAAGAAYGGVRDLSLDGLDTLTGWPLHVAAGGLLVASVGKAAQLPFSPWLSRAMVGPSAVSALLHSAAMVAAGGYLLLRVQPLLAAAGWAAPTAAWAGALTALLLGLVAVAQSDLKQLLAASTCSQLGFVVLAAGAGGRAAGGLQLVAHAAVKSGLFLAAGAWLLALGTKDLHALTGAGRRYRVVGVAAAVSALVLGGLPPLALWRSKDDVLAAAVDRSPALYAVGLAAAAVSALYAGRVIALVLRPLPADVAYDTEEQGTRRVSVAQQAVLVALAAASVLLALFLPALRSGLGGAGEPAPRAWELALSGVLALTGFALTGLRPHLPVPSLFARWLGLEALAGAIVVRPVRAVSLALARFDDRVHDSVVLGGAATTVRLAHRARTFDLDAVDRATRSIASGVWQLGALARRPQTGQVHQYYAQAVVGVALLAVLIVVVR